ncbi:MAG: RNHCP domain-containing protein [Candidatus Micrarchaeota archaeon]|nr:RNHCP domain-containing protein [Candidatus Micrarchaeota archaeon]
MEQNSRRFSKNQENFTCDVCKKNVKGTGYTDHCPRCLWSKHMDINPGDRASDCGGLMEPVKSENDRNGFIIIYECRKCKVRKRVRAAENDNEGVLIELLSR